MKQYLVISILTENKSGLLQQLANIITQMGCSIETSRMLALGGEASFALLVTGTWDTVAKLENNLTTFAKKNECKIVMQRTQPKPPTPPVIAYTIELICKENQGIISTISHFLGSQKIEIYEVYSNTYTSQTGTIMSSLVMRIYISTETSISDLRERFMLLCEDLNVDAILEPERN